MDMISGYQPTSTNINQHQPTSTMISGLYQHYHNLDAWFGQLFKIGNDSTNVECLFIELY
jgi:hypothetical protein